MSQPGFHGKRPNIPLALAICRHGNQTSPVCWALYGKKWCTRQEFGAALIEFLWWVDLSYLSFCIKTVSIALRWTVFFDTQVACGFFFHSCFRCSPFSWPEKTIQKTRSGASISCAPPSARTTGPCRSWRSGCSRWNELEEMRQLRWPFAVGRVVGNQGRKGTKGANMIGWLVLES